MSRSTRTLMLLVLLALCASFTLAQAPGTPPFGQTDPVAQNQVALASMNAGPDHSADNRQFFVDQAKKVVTERHYRLLTGAATLKNEANYGEFCELVVKMQFGLVAAGFTPKGAVPPVNIVVTPSELPGLATQLVAYFDHFKGSSRTKPIAKMADDARDLAKAMPLALPILVAKR